MRFGVYAPNFGEYSDPHNLVTLARGELIRVREEKGCAYGQDHR